MYVIEWGAEPRQKDLLLGHFRKKCFAKTFYFMFFAMAIIACFDRRGL